MQSGKKLAVCSAGDGKATYRVGADTPEIELEGGEFSRVGYPGGGEMQIAFANGDTRYIVFGRTVRTRVGTPDAPGTHANSDGVIILRGDDFVGMQVCADIDNSHYGEEVEAALQSLPQSSELFTDETYRADPETVE
jgi:hypothetical protein